MTTREILLKVREGTKIFIERDGKCIYNYQMQDPAKLICTLHEEVKSVGVGMYPSNIIGNNPDTVFVITLKGAEDDDKSEV